MLLLSTLCCFWGLYPALFCILGSLSLLLPQWLTMLIFNYLQAYRLPSSIYWFVFLMMHAAKIILTVVFMYACYLIFKAHFIWPAFIFGLASGLIAMSLSLMCPPCKQ
jgi:F0F1-type ATP synthase assembly protein I